LSEIENELIFDIDLVNQLHRSTQKLIYFSELLRKQDLSIYIPLYLKTESYFTLNVSSIPIDSIDIFCNYLSPPNNYIQYLKAFDFTLKHFEELDFLNSCQEINKILITNPKMNPGNIRKTKLVRNFSIMPTDPREITKALNHLGRYIKQNQNLNYIIRGALIYYQFLVIAPFQDGNLRTAHILLSIYFEKHGLFSHYPFSLSFYFWKNYEQYKSKLLDVRKNGNFLDWIEFFLIGIEKTINYFQYLLEETVTIKEKNINKIIESNYSKKMKSNLLQLLDYISLKPLVKISNICNDLNKTFPTIKTQIDIFVEMEILFLQNDKHRNRVYQYREFFDVLFGNYLS
ncbi:MAG: Fic family protein, partial [Bacilli bacterium]|nr:Fic family protein [Bacilli bacterium]